MKRIEGKVEHSGREMKAILRNGGCRMEDSQQRGRDLSEGTGNKTTSEKCWGVGQKKKWTKETVN